MVATAGVQVAALVTWPQVTAEVRSPAAQQPETRLQVRRSAGRQRGDEGQASVTPTWDMNNTSRGVHLPQVCICDDQDYQDYQDDRDDL